MDFIVQGHNYKYEVQTIIQVFYPNENYAVLEKLSENGIVVLSRFDLENSECYAAVFENGEMTLEKSLKIYDNDEKEVKNTIKLSIFHCLSKLTGILPAWGIMTGVRPSKRVHHYFEKGFSDKEIELIFRNKFLVSQSKTNLAIEVAKSEMKMLGKNDGSKISIYAGIPFCPTRCSYCSFAAYPIKLYNDKVDIYLDAILKELEYAKTYLDKKDLESFYIGGGTPTSINEAQLEKILFYISENFIANENIEFTVEAGRPDTITMEKLKILKKYGVNRISVNPQTMNDITLKRIGRDHSVSDFIKAYRLAEQEGFENINIDLILGLPGETIDDVKRTMEQIISLNPVNITIHTLTIKRSSELKDNTSNANLASVKQMEEMIEMASKICRDAGLLPYYMYRQKNSNGNFENVGYSKKGFECVYNVQIMSEEQTIIATGAGAATKIVSFDNNDSKINRIFNVKNVDEYMNRIDEMIDRKRKGVII